MLRDVRNGSGGRRPRAILPALCVAVALASVPARATDDSGRTTPTAEGIHAHDTAPPPATRPASPVKAVEPPQLLGDATVPYPDGAHGDAPVLLEMVVERDGTVSECTVVSGSEPFATAAVRAARTFHFEPGKRGGESARARIRFLVRFRAPEPETPKAAAPTPSSEPVTKAPSPPRAATRADVVEVVVEGDRPETAVSRLGSAEVRQMPGAFGDPFRAIEALPGVTPIVSGLPYFFVRGAPPGNVGYFVDGVRVPLLYHVGAGPGVIHPALIDKVDLYPGGYPARYGRFAGGIVAGETRPPANELHGEAGVRLVDAGGLVEAPLFGHRVTTLVSGRYGYPGLILPLFAPKVELQYWDYQLRAAMDVGKRDTLSVFAFGAYDFLGERHAGGATEIIAASEFHRVDLRYDHPLSRDGSTTLRVAATAGYDRSRGTHDLFARDRVLATRTELRHVASRRVTVRAGTDVTVDAYDTGSADNGNSTFVSTWLAPRTDVTFGAWVDAPMRVTPSIVFTPGFRTDVFDYGGHTEVGVDPRVSVEFTVSPRVRLLHAFGITHQPPSFFGPIPGVQVGAGSIQTSLQHSFGVETKLPADFVATTTLFHNVTLGLTDLIGGIRPGQDPGNLDAASEILQNPGFGNTVGFELYVRRPLTRRLGGFLAYTLSRSEESRWDVSHSPSNFDRTHVAQLGAAYDLGKRWRAGTRFMFYTGAPDRRANPGFDSFGAAGSRTWSEHGRLPAFYRVDLRLEKRWSLGERGYWAFVVDVLNATLSKEYVDNKNLIGPVTVPSVGVEAAF